MVPLLTVKPLLALRRPVEVRVPAAVTLAPDAVRAVLPAEIRLTFPVDRLPMFKVCPLVVVSVPSPANESALLPVPEIEAVGVPLPTLRKPNFALAVAVAPSKRSCVVSLSVITPFDCSNGEPPFRTGRMPVTSPEARLTALDESTPLMSEWTIPVPPMPEKMIVPAEVSPCKPVRVPAATRLAPFAVSAVVPPETIWTLPVAAPPSVKV